MLTRFTSDTIAILPPQYLGTAVYYAILAAYPVAVIDVNMRYDKRFKSAHRCTIVDTRDELKLTVPVSHDFSQLGERTPTWSDVKVSTHGAWWDVHRIALESAYGRTPFFEFYIDRFLPAFRRRTDEDCESVIELDMMLDEQIRRSFGIETKVLTDKELSDKDEVDYRRYDFAEAPDVRYYQVRADKLGFRKGLSALDLLFNMGPESQLVLKEIQESIKIND
jgi:hypothetical protein